MLKIKNVPSFFTTAYQYKFQGQERQDELGLNWDSYKWRNYDVAICRFFNIDPLSEKYSYQSHYNFSENRVVDSRELEGLEAVQCSQIINGKEVINVEVRIKPVNCSTPSAPITDEQMQSTMSNIISQSNKSYSGKTADGKQANFTFINDPDATLTVEFTDRVSYQQGYDNAETMAVMSLAMGAIEVTDFGNTQTANIQISTANSFPQSGDTPEQAASKRPGSVGRHEIGHMFGLGHVHLNADMSNQQIENVQNNVMYQLSGGNKNANKITPEQRSLILLNIPTVQ